MIDREQHIRSIRTQLRRYMNGVASAGMRQKGIVYRMNFGVSPDKLRAIAATLPSDMQLAVTLWQEDIREFKILATYVCPVEELTPEQAEAWAGMITHQEIAEQFTANLARRLPFAPALVYSLMARREEYVRVTGFLLLTRLFADGWKADETEAGELVRQGVEILDNGLSVLQLAVLRAWKRFGRQQPENAQRVLSAIAGYASCGDPVKEGFFNDLKFEFEYYA